MLASTRRREILSRLVTGGYIEAKALADDLGVDASTIRRDLDALEREGQVQRTHGGARSIPGVTADLPYALKQTAHLDEKTAIANTAASRVRDGDTIVLDSGSTTYEVAVALQNRRELTVITNDLRIGRYVADLRGFRLLVTGGELLGSVYTLTGDRAVDFLHDYTADWAFLGADGVDSRAGITNTNTLEIPVKRAMIAVARTSIVVADSSKFGRRALARVAGLDEVDSIVTDAALAEQTGKPFGEKLIRARRSID
ncbi:DeoR/GlpR family DNA-binding transcription regulator [Nocardia sp. CA2R105]|uniref:DeoR/GlpR family DNA-binding transcription regulator n=1 Tax=Nocardia coffeae TaxID=2873381 RepID=UPI001CA65963|nr:DeoR/GlpR family DNA-binding transcription regulator [Nocardia coffeae]MBY8856828.1 DeoR/GlpR family DNA-binding transcription regulator [Nocardia coffeae]